MRATGANGESSQYRCARVCLNPEKPWCRQTGLIYRAAVTDVRSSAENRSSEESQNCFRCPDCDIAVVKQTAGQGLIDIDALNLLHIHLDGGPTYKTTLKMMRRSVTAISVVKRRNQAGMKAPMAADGGDNCEKPEKFLGVAVVRADD